MASCTVVGHALNVVWPITESKCTGRQQEYIGDQGEKETVLDKYEHLLRLYEFNVSGGLTSQTWRLALVCLSRTSFNQLLVELKRKACANKGKGKPSPDQDIKGETVSEGYITLPLHCADVTLYLVKVKDAFKKGLNSHTFQSRAAQCPPLSSRAVDIQGLELVKRWTSNVRHALNNSRTTRQHSLLIVRLGMMLQGGWFCLARYMYGRRGNEFSTGVVSWTCHHAALKVRQTFKFSRCIDIFPPSGNLGSTLG